MSSLYAVHLARPLLKLDILHPFLYYELLGNIKVINKYSLIKQSCKLAKFYMHLTAVILFKVALK